MEINSNPGASRVTQRVLFIIILLKRVGYPAQAVEHPEQEAEWLGVRSVGDALRTTWTKKRLCTAESLCNCFLEFFLLESFLFHWVWSHYYLQAGFYAVSGTGIFFRAWPESWIISTLIQLVPWVCSPLTWCYYFLLFPQGLVDN